jgi:NADH dehydrogenase (ubiquinone) Fe-S protein 1
MTDNTGSRLLSTSAVRRADITLTVDGVEVTVPQGTALIQACEAACVSPLAIVY